MNWPVLIAAIMAGSAIVLACVLGLGALGGLA